MLRFYSKLDENVTAHTDFTDDSLQCYCLRAKINIHFNYTIVLCVLLFYSHNHYNDQLFNHLSFKSAN
jgi:hypothetical protein